MNRKYMFLSFFMAALFISASMFAAMTSAEDYSYQSEANHVNTLRTSYNDEYCSVFTTDKDTITADGVYKGDSVVEFNVTQCSSYKTSVKLDSGEGGRYHAEFTAVPRQSSATIQLVMQSGTTLNYRVEHDGSGWFFCDNGLGEQLMKKLESPIEITTVANAYYVSGAADPDEIRRTLNTVRETADKVCENAAGDYEKARLIARWVAENIYYDIDARDGGVSVDTIAIARVLETKRTVCGGFANLYCAMLESQGIKAVNIKGGVAGAGGVTYATLPTGVENHEFTAFYYNEEQRWVLVDSCWDTTNRYENGEYKLGVQDEQYFDITPLALSMNHRGDKAEQRHYFDSLVFLEEYLSTSAETTAGEAEEVPAEATAVTDEKTNENAEQNPPAQPDTVDNGGIILYIIIGIISVGIIAAAIFIIKAKRKD